MTTKQRIITSSKVTPLLKHSISPKKKKSSTFTKHSPPSNRIKRKSSSSSSSPPKKGSSKRTLFHYFSPSGSTTSKSKLSQSPSSLKKLTKKVVSSLSESPRSTIRSNYINSTPSPTLSMKSNGEGNGTKDHTNATTVGNLLSGNTTKGNTNSTRESLASLNTNILASRILPKQQSKQHRSSNSSVDGKKHLNKVTLTPQKRVIEDSSTSSSSLSSTMSNKSVSIEPKRIKVFNEELDQESEEMDKTKHSSSQNRTSTKNAIRSSSTSSLSLPHIPSKKEDVLHTPVSKTSLLSTNISNNITIRTPSDNQTSVIDDLSVGLIRVKSSIATLQELCTCVYETLENNNNNDDNPTVYELFDGAILGRNERSVKNPNKINIGIPINENGVSRKQLTTTILQPTIADTSSDIAPPTFSGKEEICTSCEQRLHDYLSYHQANSPYVKVLCAKSAVNPVIIVKALGNHGRQNEESSTTSNVPNRHSLNRGDYVKLGGEFTNRFPFVVQYQNN